MVFLTYCDLDLCPQMGNKQQDHRNQPDLTEFDKKLLTLMQIITNGAMSQCL